ncbi:MAG: hypothetical protein NXI28_18135, partial [bacterium]|nr:hypothetical protein [bacterium]
GKVFKPRIDHLGKPAFDPGQSVTSESPSPIDSVQPQPSPEGIVVTEDTPVLKVHKPPTRSESNQPSRKG